jgi:hypothetical protein
MQDEQGPQRFDPWPEAEFRPDVSGGDDSPRDETECDAHEKAELRSHEYLLVGITAMDKGDAPGGLERP